MRGAVQRDAAAGALVCTRFSRSTPPSSSVVRRTPASSLVSESSITPWSQQTRGGTGFPRCTRSGCVPGPHGWLQGKSNRVVDVFVAPRSRPPQVWERRAGTKVAPFPGKQAPCKSINRTTKPSGRCDDHVPCLFLLYCNNLIMTCMDRRARALRFFMPTLRQPCYVCSAHTQYPELASALLPFRLSRSICRPIPCAPSILVCPPPPRCNSKLKIWTISVGLLCSFRCSSLRPNRLNIIHPSHGRTRHHTNPPSAVTRPGTDWRQIQRSEDKKTLGLLVPTPLFILGKIRQTNHQAEVARCSPP